MNAIKMVGGVLAASMLGGCASLPHAQGPGGPRLVGSGRAGDYGQYAEVGIEFSSMGDFVALVSPTRWKSPVATGGSLSWLNPVAWSDDPGRTGRIALGQAVIAGGVVAAMSGGGGGGGSDGGVADSGTSSGPEEGPPKLPPSPPEDA